MQSHIDQWCRGILYASTVASTKTMLIMLMTVCRQQRVAVMTVAQNLFAWEQHHGSSLQVW